MPNSPDNPFYRIEAILDLYCLSANAFAKNIGIGRPETLYNIRDGKIKTISADLALKIHNCYSAINIHWLITGQGKMIDIPDDSSLDKDEIIAFLNSRLKRLRNENIKLKEELETLKINKDGNGNR